MPTPDYRTPSPDDGHEAIRAPLADAIDRLECEVERIDDAFLLLLSTVDFASGTLRTVLAGQQAISALQTQLEAALIRLKTAATCIDDLEKRVAALEAANAPEPEPEPEPTPEPQPDEPEPANDAPPEDLTEETP